MSGETTLCPICAYAIPPAGETSVDYGSPGIGVRLSGTVPVIQHFLPTCPRCMANLEAMLSTDKGRQTLDELLQSAFRDSLVATGYFERRKK